VLNGFVDWDDDLNLTDNVAYRGLDATHVRWMLTTTLGPATRRPGTTGAARGKRPVTDRRA